MAGPVLDLSGLSYLKLYLGACIMGGFKVQVSLSVLRIRVRPRVVKQIKCTVVHQTSSGRDDIEGRRNIQLPLLFLPLLEHTHSPSACCRSTERYLGKSNRGGRGFPSTSTSTQPTRWSCTATVLTPQPSTSPPPARVFATRQAVNVYMCYSVRSNTCQLAPQHCEVPGFYPAEPRSCRFAVLL